MAVLARRTWATILTETVLRVGNITSTGFDARLQHWLAASYQSLCTTYHHVELDALDTSKTASTAANTVTLPTDVFVLVGVRLRSGSTILGPLVISDFRSVFDKYTAEVGVPTRCARWANTIYFDKLPAAAYNLDIYYYKYGTAPDFTTPTSPELDRDVDEHIIEGAIRLAFPALARPDLGDVHRQLLGEWASDQIRSPLSTPPLPNFAERERTTTTTSGAQG